MIKSSGPEDGPGFFRLLIPADLAELPKARKLVGDVGQQAGLPEARIFDLRVSVSEATANAIEHAASQVEIEAWVLPDRVIVEVTNDGVFQPGLVKNEDSRRRGLGLPLMVSLADQVHVSRLSSGKTQVSLTFFLEGNARPVVGPESAEAGQPGSPAVAERAATQLEGRSREVEDRYRNLVELSPDAILVDAGGKYIFANPAAARLLGTRSPHELVGLEVVEHVHPDDREIVAERMSRVLAGAVAPPREIRLVRLDGTTVLAEVTASRVEFEGQLAVQALLRDVTERKQEEAERKASVALLALMNSQTDPRVLMQEAARVLKDASGCEAVGIRLQEGDDFPYFQTTGFPDEFVEMERSLCARDRFGDVLRDPDGYPIHECMCGNIIHGRFDPDLPFFSNGGSFWSNCTTELLATSSVADRQARTRNRCNGEGYESVALIPMRAGGETYGLLQLNDHARGRFTPASIRMFENLAATLASALAERRARQALSESEERFRTMADSIPQLAWIADPDGYIYWYNRRWYEYTGTTLADMEGWGWQSVHDPEALPKVLERWRASIGSGEPFDMEFPLRGADGVFRPFLTRVMPQKDAAGRVVQWFGTNTDITDRKRAEEARRRHEETLAGLLSAAGRLRVFERRRAWQVFLIGAVLQLTLFAGIDQLGSPSRYLGIPGAAAALMGVVAAITAGPITGMAVALVGGAGYFAFITNFGTSVAWPAIVISILLWTLAAALAGLAGDWVRRSAADREDLLGHMLAERETLADSLKVANAGLQTQNEELAASEEELQAQTDELAAQRDALQEAHTETARLLEEQSSLFRRLQEALLDIPGELSGVRFGHLYRSATEQAQVGGDFYDIFEAKGGRVGLLIGDVSGHGLEAAWVATLAKDVIHAFAHQFRRPHLVLRETNRLLAEKNLHGFVSAFLAFLDPESGILTFSSAGHPPPLLAMDGRVASLESIGTPLGVFADARYRDSEIHIGKGSLLLLYTDGVTEARRGSDFYGEQRLAESLARLQGLPVERLPSRLLDAALGFSGGFLGDDVALLAVNYSGNAGGDPPGK